MSTIHVGNLAPDVNEAVLFEKFSATGPVVSIRVCRDVATRRSLGYAYVIFEQSADAERALDTMDFEPIKGRPCHIAWGQHDPSLRRSGVGNIFIKNLDKNIDTKALYDTFSAFGNILSCKIELDENEISKGFGYVHFETQEAADQAIEKVNGMLLHDKKVFVEKWMPREERVEQLGDAPQIFTNVYVKNFGEDFEEEDLEKLFEPYGEIESLTIMRTEDGDSRGFGFVSFAEPDSARQAVEAINEKELNGKVLFCGRAQKKSERQAQLRRRSEEQKTERNNQFQGVNLYIKNLEKTIDDTRLRKEFESYGTIVSAKVMRDEDGHSKGFGFVCFQSPEEATKAVTEKNGQIVMKKPLYVALAQRKEEKQAQLAAQHMQRVAGRMMPQGTQPVGQMFTGGFYPAMATFPPGQRPTMFPPHVVRTRFPTQAVRGQPSYPGAMVGRPPRGPRGMRPVGHNQQQSRVGGAGMSGMAGQMVNAVPSQGPRKQNYRPPVNQAGAVQQPPANTTATPAGIPERQAQLAAQHVQRVAGRMMPQGTQPVGQMFTGGFYPAMATFPPGQRPAMFPPQVVRTRFPTQAVRGQHSYPGAMVGRPPRGPRGMRPVGHNQQQSRVGGAGMSGMAGQRVHAANATATPGGIPGQEMLNPSVLAQASAADQKQMLGERLFPLIKQTHPDLAGKITDMLLEIDNSELLHMLEFRDTLNAKVEEAVNVLQAHQAREQEAKI